MSVINNISFCFSTYVNESLLALFSLEEFKLAPFHMKSDKSPGPKDLNSTFFKRLWHLCGLEIFHTVITWIRD